MYHESSDRNIDQIYKEMRQIARTFLSQERVGHTLTATSLVHEAMIRMHKDAIMPEHSRLELLTHAARAMRLVLVDYARRRNAKKRTAGGNRLPLDDTLRIFSQTAIDLCHLDEALKKLHAFDAQLSGIVERRFFGCMTVDETAASLGISRRSVLRGWQFAKAWLYDELRET